MDRLFAGSGLGSLRPDYDAVDWSATPLGPVSGWSAALRSSVALAVNTRFPVTLLWGPEFVLVYNEPYSAMIGDKHPHALGRSAREVFPEIWDTIGPMLRDVANDRVALWVQDERLLLERRGFAEETYFTFSYSPVLDLDGTVAGIVDIATETTTDVVARRRLAVLADLGAALLTGDNVAEVVSMAVVTLNDARADLSAAAVHGPHLPAGAATDGPDEWPGPERGAVVEHTDGGAVAWLRLDGTSTASSGALLRLGLSPHLPVDAGYLDFVQLLGTAIAQALDRVEAQQAERQIAHRERQLSETLQRSLLSAPHQPDDLQVAVRYQAAAEQAQVGGDWYDSFPLPDGVLTLAIGDVSGHDRNAAAGMAQVRNLLRGVAFTASRPPAAVLAGLDAAMQTLEVNTLATAVLARVEQDGPEAAGGQRVLRWSNAGHLPPVLISPDGRTRLLRTEPELMLGIGPGATRHDHTVTLEPGCSVVLYTDGLIERRDADIDDSMQRLLDELHGCQDLSAEQLCDHLLHRFGAHTDDDIALLVLHA